jgi:ABC-2 type transport system ATP-binding protein
MLDAEPALPTPDIPIDLEGPRPSPRHASNSVAIHTRGLSKRFPLRRTLPWRARKYVQALDGLDLDVAGGSIHGIIGPNGSGKSTLLRVLATLILPTAGEVLVHGLDVARHPDQVRRFIGFSTGEERSLYWRLTGRQNLEFFAALYHIGSRANAVSDALARLDLSEAADRPMMTYSQGMARRLGLARALLHQPQILLLDEPAKSLDPMSRDRLHELLVGMREEHGTTILMATHDLGEASLVCDTVSILSAGHLARNVVPHDAETLNAELRSAVK